MQNYLPACKIVSTHGGRGEMKALPLCDGAQSLTCEQFAEVAEKVRAVREAVTR